MFKEAKSIDKSKIKSMYERIFDDPKEFVEYYFEKRMIPERVLISEDTEGNLISMLSRNAKHLSLGKKVFKADYIYAVATDEKHRGKGISKAMVNEAVKLSADEGTYFAYLIPVDERIYEGNGFVSIRKQMDVGLWRAFKKEWEEEFDLKVFCQERLKDNKNLVSELSRFARRFNEEILEDTVLAIYRDESYFEVLFEQLQVEKCSIAVLYKEKDIIGFAIICDTDGDFIVDYMCNAENENMLFAFVKKYMNTEVLTFKCHPIMVKITSPMFLQFLKSKENKSVNIIIDELGKSYSVTGKDGSITVKEINCNEGNCIKLSLKELTQYVFNEIEIDGMIEIEHLTGITVNEEV